MSINTRKKKTSIPVKAGWIFLSVVFAIHCVVPVFAQKGAENTVSRPKVVKLEPQNGINDLDPEGIDQLKVVFDQDMDTGGYSWVGGGETFPRTTDDPRWIDKKTCVLPVRLEKKKLYILAINSEKATNFKNESGISAEPMIYVFSTLGSKKKVPKILEIHPKHKATDVDANSIREIRVVFDRDMGEGMSWVGGGEQFPETTQKAKWADKRTCVLPIRLEPGRTYSLGINGGNYINFRSKEGVPFVPVVYTFKTRPDSE